MHHCYSNGVVDTEHDDLYTIAFWFRLLRQHGYYISCDVFNKFKDEEGNFKASLAIDVSGLLSLYEAAHLRIRGEEILDEAIAFTTTHLESMVSRISPHLLEKVTFALNRPIRKNLPRLETRHYVSLYPKEDFHNATLLKLAALDFNVLQALHQQEVSNITRQA
ncbi:(-)-germacrene D synthase-like [Ziziphus jujuba]|uniref:(-)-germacrene D synthase-like n=1 Tax=Ziziphus jujuba TaxID=326968 RepID=A0ABM3ZZP9_ZIZJJ|nr:(-)-germacrene D synthase-like [Ziziphus jujuba]